MKSLTIGLLQQRKTADKEDNLRRMAEAIDDLAARGAQLIVLQELHNTPYFCQVEDVNNFDLAEPIPGPSTRFFGEIANRLNVVIVTSLFERRAPGLYHNTENAYSRRPRLLREILLHTWRLGVPTHRHQRGTPWRDGLLGPMVSRGSTPDGAPRCRPAHLPHCHRL